MLAKQVLSQLLEPVNHRRSNRIWSGKADYNRISSCNHRSIQSERFIVAQHGCDVVTAGFKHSRAGYERASIVGDLENVSHSGLRGGQESLLRCASATPVFSAAATRFIRLSSSYFFNGLAVKNCTVTLRPIGNAPPRYRGRSYQMDRPWRCSSYPSLQIFSRPTH